MNSLRVLRKIKIECRYLCSTSIYEVADTCRSVHYSNFINNKTLRKLSVRAASSSIKDTPAKTVSHDYNKPIEKSLQHLDSHIKQLNRIYVTDIEHSLQDITTEGLSHSDGVLLLQCCGELLPDQAPASRVTLAHKIWATLKDLGAELGLDHYNALLSCYAENGHVIRAQELLSAMGSVEPDEQSYRLLMQCVCEAGDIEQATFILARMKQLGFPASEPVFAALVLGHARAGDLESCHSVLEVMRSAHVLPTAATYTALLQGLAEAGDLERLNATFREALSNNAALSDRQIMFIVTSLAKRGHHQLIPSVVPWLPTVNSVYIDNTAVHLAHLGLSQAASSLLRALPPGQVQREATIIQEMVRANQDVSVVVELCNWLAAEGRDPRALFRATEEALLLAHKDFALALLTALRDRDQILRPHYFWPLFISCGKQFREAGVFEVLEMMVSLGVSPDMETLLDYILPHCSLANPHILVRQLQGLGLSLGSIMSPVLAALLKRKQINSALQLSQTLTVRVEGDKILRHLVSAFQSTQDIDCAVSLLKVLTAGHNQDLAGQFILELLTVKNNKLQPDQMWNIIKIFKAKDVKISTFAADMILNHLNGIPEKLPSATNPRRVVESLVDKEQSITSSEQFSQHIPHPRDMSLEELECHLVELKSKNLNTRGVLRRLLQVYCRQGNLHKALHIKQEFADVGYEFSAGMLAALFDLNVQHTQLKEAESCLQELRRSDPNFVLDEHKLIDYATLLAANDRIKSAVGLIQQRGSKGVKGGPPISRNCWKLVKAVSNQAGPQQTKAMLELLVQHGYCKISNIMLGPVVAAHLNKGDLTGAATEFKECTQRHHVTPLQHELLCRLLKSPDPTGPLEVVLQAARSVHGAPSTNVTLAVALSETGCTKQLRRLIVEQGVELKPVLLLARCRRLVDEDKLAPLENLVAAYKGVTSVNVAPLLTLMMQILSRRRDCDGALALWTSLQDLDVSPEPQLVDCLNSLLHSQNRTLPQHNVAQLLKVD